MPLIFNQIKGEAVFYTAAATRADGTVDLSIPTDWSGDTCSLYLGFVSEDSQSVADSVYVGEEIAA